MFAAMSRRLCMVLTLYAMAAGGCLADIQPYRLVSGNFAPFTLDKGVDSPGALAEMVLAMSTRVGQPALIEFFPWQRALLMPLKLSRVAALPLTRIPEREADYVWLTPLYHQDFLFIRKVGHAVDQPSMDQLRQLRVGGVRGTASLVQMHRLQFPRIVEASNHEELWRLLNMDLIDAIYGGRAIETYNMKMLGFNAANYVFGPTLEKSEIWLGGSKDFTAEDVEAWQAAMKAIRREGIYAQILKKYGLPE